MPPAYELRPATEADRKFFFATRRAGFAARRGARRLGRRRRAGEGRPRFDELPVRIVLEGVEPVGYLAVLDEPGRVFLDEVALVPRAQGRGLGTALVRQVLG